MTRGLKHLTEAIKLPGRDVAAMRVLLAAALAAAAVLAAGAPGAEGTTPTLSTKVMDTNNDGTWASVLTLTFNTNVQVHTSVDDTLQDITVEGNRGSSLEVSGSTVKIFYLPPAENGIREATKDGLHVSITDTALKSTDDSTDLAAVTNSVVTVTGDSTGPKVVSAALDRDGGVLYIVMDESLAYGNYNVDSTTGGDLRISSSKVLRYGTAFENVTKYHLRDGATASSGLTMASSNSPSVHRSPIHEIRFALTPTQLSTVTGYTSPHLHMDAGAVTGIGSNKQISNDANSITNNAAIAKAINYLPRVSAAELVTNTRALSITFDESVTKKSGTFYIRNSATGAYNSGTDVTGTLAVSGTAGTATLTAQQVARVQGMSTPHLHLNAGAVTDGGGADNVKIAKAMTVTNPGPVLFGATLDEATRTLTLTLDKAVKSAGADVDQSKIRVRDGAGTTGGTALSGSTVSSTGDSTTVTITLTSSQVATVTGYAAPHAYLEAGAVTSASNVASVAPLLSKPVLLYPHLDSAVVDLNNFSTGSGQNTTYYAGKLVLKFNVDVGVNTSDADTLPKITVRDADNSPTLTLDTNASVITSTATVEIGLSNAQKEAVRAMSGDLEVLIGANAFKSDTGSLALPAVGDGDGPIPGASVTPDTTRPAITSVSLDGESGLLALNFDELVQADPGDINLSHMQLYYPQRGNFHLGDLQAGYAALSTPCVPAPCPQGGSTVTSSGDSTAVTVQLSEEHRKRAIALLDPQYWIQHQESIKDTSGNFTPSATFGGASYTPDTTAPTLVATGQNRPALDEGTGVLTLTFSESVKEGSNVDLTKIFIAGSTTASGGTALSVSGDASELTSTVDTDSEITIKLRETARKAAIGHATPYVYFASGAVVDLSNQTLAASTSSAEIADTADTTPPTLVTAAPNGPALDEGTGILTLAFDESVKDGADVDLTKIFIAGGTAASGGTALSVSGDASAVTSTVDTDAVITITLREAARQAAIGHATPHVYFASGAVKDLSDQNVAASTAAAEIADTPDTTAPTLVATGQDGPALDEGTGILTLTFDEYVKAAASDVDLTKIFMNDGSFTAGGTALAAGTPPAGATVTSTGDGAAVTVQLTEAQRKSAIGYATPHVYLGAGAVKDTSDQTIAASAASAEIADTADTTPPTLVTAAPNGPALDEGTGILTLAFDESVKDGADVDLTKIFIAGGTAASGGTALSVSGDASAVTSTVDTDAVITITLREAARQAAIGHATPHVYFTSGAVKDLSDQNVAASTAAAEIADTADTTAPQLVATGQDGPALDEGTGILTLTFDEYVKAAASDVDLTKIFMNDGSFTAGGTALAAGTPPAGATVTSTGDGAAVTVQLTEAQRKSAIGYATPHVYLGAGAVKDTSDQTIAASAASAEIADTADTTPPTLVTAAPNGPALDEGTGILTLAFDESVKDGADVDLTKIFIGDGAFSSGGEPLTGSAVTSAEDTDAAITVKLSEHLRQAAIGYADPYVRLGEGAVKDLSDQNVAASAGSRIDDTPDDDPPGLKAATVHLGTLEMTAVFDETVKAVPRSNTTVMYASEAGSSGYNAATDVAIDPPATHGTRVSKTLTAAEFALYDAMSTPTLYLNSDVVLDTSTNKNRADTAQFTPAPPSIRGTPTADAGTGRVVAGFDYEVGAGTGNFGIRDGPGAPAGPVRVAASAVVFSSNTATFTLSETDRQALIGMSDPYLFLEASAVVTTRTANGDVLAGEAGSARLDRAPDTLRPRLLHDSTTLASDELWIVFSETVKTIDATKLSFFDGTVSHKLSSQTSPSEVSKDGQTVKVSLRGQIIAAAQNAGDDLRLRAEQGAVADTSNNASVPYAGDGQPRAPPVIRSASAVSLSSVMVSFSEPLLGGGSGP